MSSGEKSDSYIAAVAMQLQQTQSLIQTLLSEIRENSAEQMSLNIELKSLRLNVNTLFNIIRGDDGNSKPLVLEVEIIKHAERHLDKRISNVVEDFDEQVLSLAKKMADIAVRAEARVDAHKSEIETRINLASNQQREYETTLLKIKQDDEIDLRLHNRGKLQIYSTIILAAISLVGSMLALWLR